MKPPNLTSIEAWLRSDFNTLVGKLGANETAIQKWGEALISRYTEPQRHYHTIEHISAMLKCLDRYLCLVKDEITIKLAIFFHDWIYDPQAKTNELESINCFKEFAAELNLPESMITRVSEYIEHTIAHTLPANDGEADSDLHLFLDFDLEVLSRGEADYALYATQIRQEYSHFSEWDYCTGRTKVIRAFLERDRLYFSDAFYEMYEEVARGNLKGEAGLLEGKLEVSEGSR
jgi:predicted metal-dependent HD superfamily phosphohydrolase